VVLVDLIGERETSLHVTHLDSSTGYSGVAASIVLLKVDGRVEVRAVGVEACTFV
jgi:hypothetical protein